MYDKALFRGSAAADAIYRPTRSKEDEWGNEIDDSELVFVVGGCLGLGAEVGEALRPTVVPGIRGDEQGGTK